MRYVVKSVGPGFYKVLDTNTGRYLPLAAKSQADCQRRADWFNGLEEPKTAKSMVGMDPKASDADFDLPEMK